MKLRNSVALARSYTRQRLRDAAANRRWLTGDARFLALRHPQMFERGYEGTLLRWLEENLPEVRARFELQLLPGRLRSGSHYALHLPWLQDPVQRWSERAHVQANRLARACDERGIPVINRVDQLANATKLEGSERIRTAGLRTPRVVRIDDVPAFRAERLGLRLPIIVRQDWVHGGRIRRVRTKSYLEKIGISRFEHPIAMEFVDVRSPKDELVRKYRYVVAGDIGVPLSMHVCKAWRTKGSRHIISRNLVEEERAYAEHAVACAPLFLRATKALGLDIAAFDYGITPEGEVVVWEANPYPHILLTSGRGAYRTAPTVRVFAAITRHYLRTAKLDVPTKIDDMLDHAAVRIGG